MSEFVIDIGNTLIKILEVGKEEVFSFSKKDEKELKAFIDDLNDGRFYLSSVNYELNDLFIKMIKGKFSYEVLNKAIMKEVSQKQGYIINNLDVLGPDLFADIVGSYSFVSNEIVVDLGTATKILVITAKKEFIGGVIFPGVLTCNKSLFDSTSLLDNHDLELPHDLVSIKTKDAINAGSIYGSAFMIKEYIDQIKRKYGLTNCCVVFTGGFSELILKAYQNVKHNNDYVLDKMRTLRGIMRSFNL